MAAPVNVPTLRKLLERSRLVGGADEVRALHERWLAEASDAEDVEQFKRFLVAHRYVTEYQAAMLARGHADGFLLDQYRLLDRLGKGRMAGVYKAVHALGQTVAVKVLPPSKAKDPQLLARFQREARLALQLRHPNVVQGLEVGECNGLNYFAMEYLDGETLDEVLTRRGRLPIPEAVRLVCQALLGLQHLHERGIVHRDLKPANLMLVPGRQPDQPDTTLLSQVKILDVGLGRALLDETSPVGEAEAPLTGEGVLLGTPDYLAPEQARSAHSVDVRADIYSLGCVFYHLIAGQPPFPDKNVLSQIVRHATEAARPLAEFVPQVPEGLQQIVNWMIAKDPAQRYATPMRAAQALQIFLSADHGLPVTQEWPSAAIQNELHGLEASLGKTVPPAAPPPTPPTVAAGPPPPDIPVGKLVGRRERSRSAERSAGPSSGAERPRPAEKPARPIETGFDVELIAVPPPSPPVPKRTTFPRRLDEIDRRDYLMLGLGCAGGAAAVLVGYLMAQLVRPIRNDPSPPPPAG